MRVERTVVLLGVALVAGLAAAYLVATRAPSPSPGADADYYCYQASHAWVCSEARTECEARLARESQPDIRKGCTPYTSAPLTP